MDVPMKRIILLPALLLAIVFPVRADPPNLTPPPADADETAWMHFGENLVMALKTDNDGLRLSALQQIVVYGERLDVRDARFELVRLFRDHKDERVRMTALNALSKVRDNWVAYFLRRSARFESDPHLAGLMFHAALANERG
jgi:hypothetical protein